MHNRAKLKFNLQKFAVLSKIVLQTYASIPLTKMLRIFFQEDHEKAKVYESQARKKDGITSG